MKRKIKIIIMIIILALTGYELYTSTHKPDKTIIVKFRDIPPVLQHFPRARVKVYYRGFNVGQVSKMELCCDQKSVLFFVDIYYKNLKLPKNTRIYLTSEDIYGTSHIALYYPAKPSKEELKDGDIVYASGVYERLDQFLINAFHEGKLEEILSNVTVISKILRKNLEKNNGNINEFVNDLKKTNHDVDSLINNLSEFVGDRQFQNDIKSSTDSASKLLSSKDVQTAPKKLDKTLSSLDTLNNSLSQTNKNIPELNQNITVTNKSIARTRQNLKTTNKKLNSLDEKIPKIPPSLLENTNRTLETANCIGSELSGILSKRFILFRLMFGNPAASLKKCQ